MGCQTCQTYQRVRALRARRRERARQTKVALIEYCWNCGYMVDEARLVVLTARRSRFTSCGIRCHRSLRQQLRRRRLRRLPVDLPPTLLDGSRLAWSAHDLVACPAAGSELSRVISATGLDPVAALLGFLSRSERPRICNSCGLYRLLPIGQPERARAKAKLTDSGRRQYRFKSDRVRSRR